MTEPTSPEPPSPRELAPLIGVWFALAALAIGFAWMLLLVRRDRTDGFDRAVLARVVSIRDDYPAVTAVARGLTILGNDAVTYPTVIVLSLVLHHLSRGPHPVVGRREWAFFLGVTLVGTASGTLVKRLVDRPRPELAHRLVPETSPSFPSGHALYAAVVLAMVALLILRVFPHLPAGVRWLGVFGCATLALGIAASRVWLGVHFPTDVLGGLCLGLAWVTAAWTVRLHHR